MAAGKRIKASPFIGRLDEGEATQPLEESTEIEVQPRSASDTTIHGGLYIVNGQVVDANGKPLPGHAVVDGQIVAVAPDEGN